MDRKPWLLIENADNAEHPLYEQTKDQPAIHKIKLLEWFGQLNAETSGEIDEKVRMSLSKWSVLAWKAAGIYPTVTVAAKSAKRRH